VSRDEEGATLVDLPLTRIHVSRAPWTEGGIQLREILCSVGASDFIATGGVG
jgi:hypothetical protein